MIPVHVHLEAVKRNRLKRLNKAAVNDLDALVDFDPTTVASISLSDFPYEAVRNSNIFSHPAVTSPRKNNIRSSDVRMPVPHQCENSVPVRKKMIPPPSEYIRQWHEYYELQKVINRFKIFAYFIVT